MHMDGTEQSGKKKEECNVGCHSKENIAHVIFTMIRTK